MTVKDVSPLMTYFVYVGSDGVVTRVKKLLLFLKHGSTGFKERQADCCRLISD